MQQFGVKYIDHIALCEIHISGKYRIWCECDLAEDIAPPFWEWKKSSQTCRQDLKHAQNLVVTSQ